MPSSAQSNSRNRTEKTISNSTSSYLSNTKDSLSSSYPSSKLSSPYHHLTNGDHTIKNVSQESVQSSLPTATSESTMRLTSPLDNSSRMSVSSNSSKDSPVLVDRAGEMNGVHLSLSEPAISFANHLASENHEKYQQPSDVQQNGHETKSSTPASTTESVHNMEYEFPPVSKAERDQEIQKYYRADLIHHLVDWPSTQLEKQLLCLKVFDEYYAYSAKISTAFTELKALKSNFRVLEIKRNIQTQRLLRCQQPLTLDRTTSMLNRDNDKIV
ncbi:unnamed protein product [Didymodactylos carnosus]|uniref:Uncharacterized protein n=1 Tax=Didymodactylos carnosus TaxID=1234261 RepID=A0A8S2PSM4_9BILA|nr:unnamed protein product [Didymodactylos carnosus]CAF4067938.1 unnamed protein product [Didymodactylos carnosus]